MRISTWMVMVAGCGLCALVALTGCGSGNGSDKADVVKDAAVETAADTGSGEPAETAEQEDGVGETVADSAPDALTEPDPGSGTDATGADIVVPEGCPLPAAPPGSGKCPEVCTECDGNNVCTIGCTGVKACEGDTIDCPPGYACLVVCDGLDACDTNKITCPPEYACTLACEAKDACGDLHFNCADGPCTIECGTHYAACEGADVNCGAGACQATCDGSQAPDLNGCEGSCSCSGC